MKRYSGAFLNFLVLTAVFFHGNGAAMAQAGGAQTPISWSIIKSVGGLTPTKNTPLKNTYPSLSPSTFTNPPITAFTVTETIPKAGETYDPTASSGILVKFNQPVDFCSLCPSACKNGPFDKTVVCSEKDGGAQLLTMAVLLPDFVPFKIDPYLGRSNSVLFLPQEKLVPGTPYTLKLGGAKSATPTPLALQGIHAGEPYSLAFNTPAKLFLNSFANCAIRALGTVWCWGDPNEIGWATPGFGSTPSQIPSLTGVTDLAIGRTSVCAVKKSGSVSCWGKNYGETPTAIPNLKDVKSIVMNALVADYTCALDNNDKIQCWFGNSKEPLKTFSSVDININARIPAPRPLALVAGSNFIAAVASDSAVYYWNYPDPPALCGEERSIYQLTDASYTDKGTSDEFALTKDGILPYAHCGFSKVYGSIIPLSGIVKIASGIGFVCGVTNDRTVKCYIGDPGFGGHEIDVDLTGVVSIAAGQNTACADLQDGSIKCWSVFSALPLDDNGANNDNVGNIGEIKDLVFPNP